MNNKKLNKINLIIYIVVLFFVFVMLIVMAHAFFTRSSKSTNDNKVINSVNMLTSFDENNQINIHGINNGYIETREFSIDNYSSDTIGNYKIILEVITPLSNMVDENFVYSIEGETDSKDKSNSLINVNNVPVPVVTKELTGGSITPNTTHKYKVTLKMNNSNIKYPGDSLFSLKIKVKSDN